MTEDRPLLLDATAALAADPDEGVPELAGVLARSRLLQGVVRIARGGPCMVDPLLLAGGGMPLDAVRSRLLGGARPAAATSVPRSRAAWPRRPRAVPPGTVLLKPGIVGWDDPPFRAWLDRHPAVSPVALVDKPVGWDWPEYADAGGLAALRAGLAALSQTAQAVVVPDDPTRAWMRSALAEAGRGSMPVHVVDPPSVLAGTTATTADPALAAVAYLVVPGPIEDRANTLLLLQIWRDLIRAEEQVPTLVLAGRRGRQIEEIRPLLDWNEAVGATVVEASLSPEALRHLIAHARAVLAPAFAGGPAALLRDAQALGTPVIAAARSVDARGSGLTALDPLDGPAWRAAILAAARRAVPERPAAVLPGGNGYLRRIAALLPTFR